MINRYAKRRDKGERSVIEALEDVGCLVWQLDEPGDLLVCVRPHGGSPRLVLLEVKEKRGKLTEKQKKSISEGWPVMVARNVQQALFAVGLIG